MKVYFMNMKNNLLLKMHLKLVIEKFAKKTGIDIEEVKIIYSVCENDYITLYCCLKVILKCIMII